MPARILTNPVILKGLISGGASLLGNILPAILQNGSNSTSSGISNAQGSLNSTGGMTQGSAGSGAESGANMTIGNNAGIANLLTSALGSPTGNSSAQAFGLSQLSAQTANNLQSAHWGIAQGLSLFSNAMANMQSAMSQASAMRYNAKQAENERAWAQSMRQTAYQDTVKDLKAAGLNPILAAMNGATGLGSGASANIGAQSYSQAQAMAAPSMHAANAQAMYDYGNNTAQFINNALSTISNAKQMGYYDIAKSFEQSMDQVTSASQQSIQSEATKTSLEAWYEAGKGYSKALKDSKSTSSGAGGGRGR